MSLSSVKNIYISVAFIATAIFYFLGMAQAATMNQPYSASSDVQNVPAVPQQNQDILSNPSIDFLPQTSENATAPATTTTTNQTSTKRTTQKKTVQGQNTTTASDTGQTGDESHQTSYSYQDIKGFDGKTTMTLIGSASAMAVVGGLLATDVIRIPRRKKDKK